MALLDCKDQNKRLIDDFSCNPSKWSWEKLRREVKNGLVVVVAEYERRLHGE